MKRLVRMRDTRLVACLVAVALFQQFTVLPVLHVLHWAASSAARPLASERTVTTVAARSQAPARHDANACPTCAALAQYRAGAIPLASVWYAPRGLSLPVIATAARFARSAERLVSAARGPPSLSA